MKKLNKEKNKSWSEMFDLLWGEAPKGSLKNKKGEDVKSFLSDQITCTKKEAIEEVYDAWNNPGKVPGYHFEWQARLRLEWPVLANALDNLKKEKKEKFDLHLCQAITVGRFYKKGVEYCGICGKKI